MALQEKDRGSLSQCNHFHTPSQNESDNVSLSFSGFASTQTSVRAVEKSFTTRQQNQRFFLACFREKKKSSRHKRRAWEGATFNCNVQWFPLTAGSLGAAHPRSAAVYVEPFSELHGFCEHHTKCALSQIPKVLATTTKICNDDGSTDTHVHSFNATVTPPYSSRRQGTHPSRASARKRRSKPMLP